jgi:adenylate cyclase
MFTDIVGYTSLTQKDESATLQALDRHRSLLRPHFSSHGGREIKTIGDAFLVQFQSALDAVLCAVAVQQMMHDRKVARGEQLSLRIGIHVGDVVESGSDILGDAVNIASRIYPLAEPGGICISSEVYNQIRNRTDLPLASLGEKLLKNVEMPVEVYKVAMPWEQSTRTEAVPYPMNRIAILPFSSFSPDPDDAYFADGITDEIISAVAGISGLNVISRTSVIGYKGTTKKLKEIGKELEVGSILEGTFKKAGTRLRVTTQLIDVAGDKHLWAQSYDRNMDDVFAVQSDVAKQVADALRVRILSPEKERLERKPTESTEAYSLYLKGRYLWNKRGYDNARKAAELFELAVKEDPGFALGYVGQADCCLYLADPDLGSVEVALKKADAMVAKALELDPGLAEAHATKGLALMHEYRPSEAEEEFKKAVQLNPNNAAAHRSHSWALMTQLRWDEALEEGERAMELDPLMPAAIHNLVHVCYHRRDYGRALELGKRLLSLDPNSPGVHFLLMLIYGEMNMPDEARREADAYVEQYKDRYPLIGKGADVALAYTQKDKDAVRRLLDECAPRFQETGSGAWEFGVMFFFIGEKDKGFEWFERSYSRREFSLMEIKNEQTLNSVRTDPRYLDLLKRLGLD